MLYTAFSNYISNQNLSPNDNLSHYLCHSEKHRKKAKGVFHVEDYGFWPANIWDFIAASGWSSFGNDPGVLISASSTPVQTVSVDIKNAFQQEINENRPYIAFRIQTATETDFDELNDVWFFASAIWTDTGKRPIMEYYEGVPVSIDVKRAVMKTLLVSSLRV